MDQELHSDLHNIMEENKHKINDTYISERIISQAILGRTIEGGQIDEFSSDALAPDDGEMVPQSEIPIHSSISCITNIRHGQASIGKNLA